MKKYKEDLQRFFLGTLAFFKGKMFITYNVVLENLISGPFVPKFNCRELSTVL